MSKSLLSIASIFLSTVLVIANTISCTNQVVYEVGDPIDSLHHVKVYYNKDFSNNSGRNVSKDGYNLGLKYQCVEFVKRYYFEHYKHKMKNSYGNAVDFYNKSLPDGKMNKDRGLVQYSNPSKSKPQIGDLLVFDGTIFNKYGHVAIVSNVTDNEIELIQQNTGAASNTRDEIKLEYEQDKWLIDKKRILGWLRKK